MTQPKSNRKHQASRRDFVAQLGIAASIPLIDPPQLVAQSSPNNILREDPLVKKLLPINDQRVTNLLNTQQTDSSLPFYGGFPNRFGICFVGTAANVVKQFVCSLISSASTHFESKLIEERLDLAMRYLLEAQHADGTIDLVSTNFHSPPDTGFAVEPMAVALSCVRQQAPDSLKQFQFDVKTFLQHAGQALTRGGIHTPNHRWVVCAALARIHALFPDQKYVARVEQWLAEKIDIDKEGHYTERSTSLYSPLVDRCLITVSRILERPELLEPVRRNLDLTKYLLHANGEIVTEVSRRQDQFRIAKPANYYFSYRQMALLDNDGSYAAMARGIQQSVGHKGLVQLLGYFLEDSSLLEALPASTTLPDDYEKHFSESRCVRIRRKLVDATILGSNQTFFTFHKNNAAIRSIRMATAFFGKGQFSAESLIRENNRYVLKQELVGPYYQPLPNEKLTGDGNWLNMPRENRQQSEVQPLTSVIEISEQQGKINIRFRVYGTAGVPLAIEMGFDRDAKLSGVTKVEGVTDTWLLTEQGGSVTVGENTIQFGPGRSKHAWTQLRGAAPKLDANCVYVTDFTPFDFELSIS